MTDPTDRVLTSSEVAAMFRVDPKTVTRWALAGKVPCFYTPGGTRRYRESDIRPLLQTQTATTKEP